MSIEVDYFLTHPDDGTPQALASAYAGIVPILKEAMQSEGLESFNNAEFEHLWRTQPPQLIVVVAKQEKTTVGIAIARNIWDLFRKTGEAPGCAAMLMLVHVHDMHRAKLLESLRDACANFGASAFSWE